MSNLTRLFLATLSGLVLAAGVHIAIIFAAPSFAENDAFNRLQETLTEDQAQLISPAGGEKTWLPLPDPATAVAACAFDLSDGPVRVTAKPGQDFLSFSFHTKTRGVFFAVTDRAAIRGELELVVMTPRQLDEARAAEDENDPSRDVRIVAPQEQGYIVVRVAAPRPSQRVQAEEAAKAVTCTIDEDEAS
ncbi:DUF1254 domain-containing protein [Microvirga puerhi]|uniref:DUF1254 domain-containing protein n=1 Tax=Microvirga puerhi TaxID=2876078 RepID=A0ABS7VLG3_9HYPH|nr:DUF1254 domain-containing protein [Microvirga puerhi]MBZ6076378.1 hypothetical protein [Microvirga puerhi]